MQYFVTIYIHPMQGVNIPHAFLGLTHTHPDELDSLKDIDIYKYQAGYYSDKPTLIHVKDKWYNNIYPSILDSNFGGEGFWGFAPVKSKSSHWGIVFENNQYAPKWHDNFQQYTYIDERPLSTFWQQNRCVFEVSQEQYEKLLDSIKTEVERTRKRTPNLKQDNTQLNNPIENLYYNSNPNPFSSNPIHNCVTWVLNKLDSIGIEVFNIKEWLPSAPILNDLQEYFTHMRPIHTTFRRFQSIDSNLESIKGAKAFRYWARTYLDDSCMRQLYVEEKGINDMPLDEAQKALLIATLFNIKEVYVIFDKILQSKLDKLNNTQDLQGDFELIYFDKQDKKIKTLKAQNDYEPMEIAEFNLTIPANNCTISKFYPFIFIPKDMMNARVLYHKYDYGKVSQEYQRDRNEFYYNVLAGIQSDKYWSESYHKLCKMQTN